MAIFMLGLEIIAPFYVNVKSESKYVTLFINKVIKSYQELFADPQNKKR